MFFMIGALVLGVILGLVAAPFVLPPRFLFYGETRDLLVQEASELIIAKFSGSMLDTATQDFLSDKRKDQS